MVQKRDQSDPDSCFLLAEKQYAFAKKSNNTQMMANAIKTKGVYYEREFEEMFKSSY